MSLLCFDQPHFATRNIALINQIFFGFDVVINTGFCQLHTAGNILESSSSRTLPIEELCRFGENRLEFELVLAPFGKRRGDDIIVKRVHYLG